MLEAARSEFAEKGYTHATLEEIAQRAEFGKGTLYNYFPGGKEEILFAIFDEGYDAFVDLIRSSLAPDATAGMPVREAIRRFLERCFTFFGQSDDLFMILVKEAHRFMLGDDEDKVAYFIRQRNRLVDELKRPIEKAMEAGSLRRMDSDAVANMLLGNINGCHLHSRLRHHSEAGPCADAPTPADNADFLTTMLFDGILVPESPDRIETVTT